MTVDLAARLRGIFAAELEDQLRHAVAHLEALERAPGDAEQIRGLFRVMHTLKGAARAAGVTEAETICHDAEALMVDVRDGSRAVTPAEMERLRASVDRLRHVLDDMRDSRATERTATTAEAPARPDATVRVASRRLEDLLGASSRLLITTGRVSQASAIARSTQELVGAMSADWRDLQRRIRSADGDRSTMALVHEIDERMRTLTAEANLADTTMNEVARDLAQVTGEIGGGIRELRLRPVAEALEGLATVIRDVAASAGKTAHLVTEGKDLEADRSVVEHLREALLHLVRNAVDHGIESPVERRARGKPERGTIGVSARILGDRILVTVRDDGGGIDVEGIRRALRARGEQAEGDDQRLIARLFGGGVSTRAGAGLISGRGVGLDAAAAAVRRMRGSIRVETVRGSGSVFTIDAPLALATIRAVICGVGGTLIAIPTAYVQRMARAQRDDLVTSQGRPAIVSSGAPIPVVPLARLIGATGAVSGVSTVTAVIVAVEERYTALQVDSLLTEQEIVVRPIRAQGSEPLTDYTGVALLANGDLALVLNVPAVADAAARLEGDAMPERRPATRAKRILVVDDSLTTRTLEQSVLEAAGYEVETGFDGAEGWRILQERGADLVVADVEMPRMDGLELCRAVRASARFRELPVVLITALETPEDRRRGLEAGADAYLGKSSFEREGLLGVIEELIGR